MEGVFLRKKFNVWLFLVFVCGLFLIGLYVFITIVDPEATSELLTVLIVGILICLAVIPSWLWNFGAFICLDEDSITAKYHWFGHIDCKLSDVVFAVARVHTLIIQLKDGQTYTIMGVVNSWPLASAIRSHIPFEVTEQPEVLIEKLNDLKSDKKKGLIYIYFGLAFMFVHIFLTVFLTGERELHEFSGTDWTIFAIMGVIEMATLIVTFYFAGKTAKKNVPIEKLQYTIRRTVIETKPVLPGFVIAVYTDDDYNERLILFGYPHQTAVYYMVQQLDSEYHLVRAYVSDTFEDGEGLSERLDSLIDITDKVLH